MHKIFLLASITFKDSIRSKALYGIFFFGLALFLANILVTGIFSWEVGKVAADVGLSVVSLSGLAIIFFFSIQIVSNDLERKTIYMILSKPISKVQYLLGKYMGLSLIILVSSAILGSCAALSFKLATLGAEAFIPAQFSWNLFWLALAFITLSLLVLQALSFLCVSITSNSFTAVLLCLMLYFIGQNLERVVAIVKRGKMFLDNPLLLKFLDGVAWVMPNLAAFDMKTAAAYGLPVDGSTIGWTALYGVTYIGVCLALAGLIFQRREIG
jgi:ABC-type transport system involved in multi-copper enzyme maturation permease subunit